MAAAVLILKYLLKTGASTSIISGQPSLLRVVLSMWVMTRGRKLGQICERVQEQILEVVVQAKVAGLPWGRPLKGKLLLHVHGGMDPSEVGEEGGCEGLQAMGVPRCG